MVLIARSIAVRDLDQEHQTAIAATGLQVPPIQCDFDSGYQPLVKREFGAWDARRPAKVCPAVFAEPLIEGDLFKCRIKGAAPAGRLGHEGSAEEQECEAADHSTFYSFAERCFTTIHLSREPNRANGF
jgi:hypothetical protein